MRSIKTRTPCGGVGLDGMRRLRHGSTDGVAHRVMMMQRRWLGSCGPREISLSLHRVRSPVSVYSSHSSASYTCPRLIRGVIEQSSDVVYEERVKLFSDLLLVCEFECTLERNPTASQFCHRLEHRLCLTRRPSDAWDRF
jgi:hypothetical protein